MNKSQLIQSLNCELEELRQEVVRRRRGRTNFFFIFKIFLTFKIFFTFKIFLTLTADNFLDVTPSNKKMPRGSFVDYVSEVIPRQGSGLHSSSSTLTSSVQRDLSVRSQPRPVSTTGSKYKYSGQHHCFSLATIVTPLLAESITIILKWQYLAVWEIVNYNLNNLVSVLQ